jgi:hypothetical protein
MNEGEAQSPPLTGIERARAQKAKNAELRRQGLLPPIKRSAKKSRPASTEKPRPAAPSAQIGGGGHEVAAASSVLSPEKLERIREEARKRVEAELRQRAEGEQTELVAKLLEEETLRLRRAHGLTNHLDDVIEITINAPPFATMYAIDSKLYHHGYTYHVPRKLYDVLREQMARGWDAEDRAGNPNRKFYRDPAVTMNPMLQQRRYGDGTVISRETTISAKLGLISGAATDTAMAGGL